MKSIKSKFLFIAIAVLLVSNSNIRAQDGIVCAQVIPTCVKLENGSYTTSPVMDPRCFDINKCYEQEIKDPEVTIKDPVVCIQVVPTCIKLDNGDYTTIPVMDDQCFDKKKCFKQEVKDLQSTVSYQQADIADLQVQNKKLKTKLKIFKRSRR